MLTVVLDVNVIISAVMSARGTPRQALEAWQAEKFEVVVSDGILAEVSPSYLPRPSAAGRGLRPLMYRRSCACFAVKRPTCSLSPRLP